MADFVVYHPGASQKQLLLAAIEQVLERHERVSFACLARGSSTCSEAFSTSILTILPDSS